MLTQDTAPLLSWIHDPSGQAMDYTARLKLGADDVISSVSVTVVDTNDIPVVGSPLIVSDVSFALIAGTVWGVTFYLSGGTSGSMYRLRLRFTLTSSPTTGTDRTLRIRCENT